MLDPSYTQLLGALAFVLTGLIVYVLTPFMAHLASALGLVDDPGDGRRMHEDATPLLGGLVMYLAVMITTVLLVTTDDTAKAIIVGGTIITIVGLIDDLREINPLVKFAGQMLAVGAALLFDVRMTTLSFPFGSEGTSLPTWASIVISVVWFIAIINMVNFIDGLDGLAAGVCSISAVTFSIIAFSLDRVSTGLIALTLAGATLAFLRFNFHPATIFMGDTGSMFLGFVLGVISLQGVMKSSATVTLILPLLVLGVPFFDLFLIVLRRLWRRVPFYRAGQDHVHHELVFAAGFSQRKSVLLLYGWCVVLNGTAIAMSQDWFAATVALGCLATVATLAIGRMLVRSRQLRVSRDDVRNGDASPPAGSQTAAGA